MPTLHWIGKEKVMSHDGDVPYRVLEHGYGFDNGKETTAPTNSGNKIIHGDNLEALKSLLPEYEGKIKCICIDPPYNTGNEGWVYNDNVNHPSIKKWLGEVVGKESEDLTRHDKWLCMMYPRLKLLHRLLSEDGVIFISIDDNEQANLKLMCDEIFGAGNFLGNVIWQRAYAPVNTKKRFSPNHDFITCYSKNYSDITFLLRRTQEANDRYINPDNDPRGLYKPDNLSVGPIVEKQIYPITTPSGRVVYPPKGYCWRYTQERFRELIEDNRIWFGESGNNVPAIKRFISEVKDGITPMTVWTYKEVGHTQDAKKEIKAIFPESGLPFDTPKSLQLIERVIGLNSDTEMTILDSFAGSGTTAHAVLNLNKQDGGNRKFILIEMEDYANTITAERVKRVINGYADKEGTGGSFDYYSLGEPLFMGDNQEELNPAIPIEKIKEYIWFSETREVYQGENKEESNLLGVKEDTAYYFFYNHEAIHTLDYELLTLIKTKAAQYVIYANNCLLPKDYMLLKNIRFKQIPGNISRL